MRITHPPAGANIYAEVMYLAGTAPALSDERFVLRLVGPDGDVISSHIVDAQQDGEWQIELLHSYSGEPIEVVVEALPVGAAGQQLYDAVTVMLAGIQHRPASLTGSIDYPAPAEPLGGEAIIVSGAFSGVPGNSFWLALVAADGRLLDERQVELHNPYHIDLMPWSAELATSGYVGPAEVRAFVRAADGTVERALDSVAVVIAQEAG
ncbi:MAG: hypothetical protein ACUVSX_04975 [Aggregatilineales bacterium]